MKTVKESQSIVVSGKYTTKVICKLIGGIETFHNCGEV